MKLRIEIKNSNIWYFPWERFFEFLKYLEFIIVTIVSHYKAVNENYLQMLFSKASIFNMDFKYSHAK